MFGTGKDYVKNLLLQKLSHNFISIGSVFDLLLA